MPRLGLCSVVPFPRPLDNHLQNHQSLNGSGADTMLLNVALATLVTTGGFWLLWSQPSWGGVAVWALAAGGFLWWKAGSVTEIWAWSTLGLGLQSVMWPIQRMIQFHDATGTLSDEEMGAILSAVVMGLFSSVFWLSFSYGLFQRAWRVAATSVGDSPSGASPLKEARRRGQ
ncbi:MAG: hypothetical protein NNA23_00530 [Nitrospira sp.]|nr:hypothetical protein [Nitrospira sp.]